MKYYLGIDGGGTVTTAAVANENGEIIYKAQGKTINFYGVAFDCAKSNLKDIVNCIYKNTGINEFYSVFIGCSALDGEADESTIHKLCDGVINAQKVGMNSDAYVALKSATGNCVAICGTGSMVIGENKEGKVIVKGGWGHILGDEGSAYAIAQEALKKICVLNDKKIHSLIAEKAQEYFEVKSVRGIIDKVYAPDCNKSFFAGFAKDVDFCAENGCELCQGIIKSQAQKFAGTFEALYNEIEDVASLSLYGGVLCKSELFRSEFINSVKAFCPDIKTEILSVPPEEGALKAAMEL